MRDDNKLRMIIFGALAVFLAGLLAITLTVDVLDNEEAKTAVAPAKAKSTHPNKATMAELKALERLSVELEGAVVYTRGGRARKVVIGDWRAIDLAPGDFARWGPDGEKIAIYHKGLIYVINADGTDRKQLVSVRGKARHCPIDFHPNGQEIIYVYPDHGLWAVRIDDGTRRNLRLSIFFDGEPGISAQGNRLAARRGHDLYGVDLVTGRYRKYAWGCSSGISPNGKWLMTNVRGHRKMLIYSWDGKRRFTIDATSCEPDRSWDNQHWSNHTDYIAVQGDGGTREAYVFSISKNLGTRVTWEGGVNYPDLFVISKN